MAFLKMNLVVVTTILVACMQFATIVAVDHIVGGKSGWTSKDSASLYTAWAKGEKFAKGDNLIFNFGASHNVAELAKEAYDTCNVTAVKKPLDKSPVKITLTTGIHYYVCTPHCKAGQKLTVEVK